jgi:putative heme-binding domain-containing protein
VTFDRAFDKSVESRLTGLTVSCGEYVRAGDRYETLRPPYVVVKAQLATPTRDLKIRSASLSADGKTLSVKIEEMPWRAWYALAIPGVKLPGQARLGATVDVDFELAGEKWAHLPKQAVVEKVEESRLTQGGDWARGKELFFGDAQCSACHMVRGEGGTLAANLSNLVHVNPESVLLDITQPSARINPDYISFVVETKDGDVITGTVRREGDKVFVTQAAETVTELKSDQIKEMRPSALSIMPDGYKDILGEKNLRDLLTFLTKERMVK